MLRVIHHCRARLPRAASTLLPFLLLLLLWGCAQFSVSHLDRNPLTLDGEQRLELEFWRFDYTVRPIPGGYRVEGRAFPRSGVPEWATYADQLWFAAYLADASGKVLAKDDARLDGMIMKPQGVPFVFVLRERNAPPTAAITFGYRMTLTRQPVAGQASPPASLPGTDGVFFASESAVSSY